MKIMLPSAMALTGSFSDLGALGADRWMPVCHMSFWLKGKLPSGAPVVASREAGCFRPVSSKLASSGDVGKRNGGLMSMRFFPRR